MKESGELSKGAAEKRVDNMSARSTLKDMGIEQKESHRWQKMSSIPDTII